MPQKSTWEKEYKNPQLVKLSEEPRNDLRRYIKFLKKAEGIRDVGLSVLDLGSGNGKNGNYLAELGYIVSGLEISQTAVLMANTRAREKGLTADYRVADMGSVYPFPDEHFDLIIDVMSSNSLNEQEREKYLRESHRVLKKGGHFFVRALCKDGDDNAKKLLKLSPGSERDTYRIKEMNLIERVFSEEDFRKTYSAHFEIQELTKKTNYAQFKGQPYKRNYWLAYLKKV